LKEFGFGGDIFGGEGRGTRFSYSTGSPFGGRGRQQAQSVPGSDIIYELSLTLHEAAFGTHKTVTIPSQGLPERIAVKIPKGLTTGKKLRLAGKGNPGPLGGPRGDLYIQAVLIEDPVFSVEGHDLITHREIKITEALLGATISVPTLDDKRLNLKIPAGTKSGTKLRLPAQGLPEMRGGKKGDLYVHIHIQVPKTLTREQKELVEKLSETGI
jgi:curved DNA-binding protein